MYVRNYGSNTTSQGYRMKHLETIELQGSIADMRNRIAAEQAAMHKVNLAVARWRGSLPAQDSDAPAPDDAATPASQLRWHAEAQCHFMCWLEQGGFAQAEAQAESQAPLRTTAQPASTQHPATKEITAQAKQSATPTLPAHCNDCAA